MSPALDAAVANFVNAMANVLPLLATGFLTWLGAHYSSKSGAKIATDAASAPTPDPKLISVVPPPGGIARVT